MTVCFCLNNLGSLGLGAMLASLIQHCSDSSKLKLYFLCSFVDSNTKNAINGLLANTNFKGKAIFIDFDARKEFGKYRPLQNDWTTYGRLLIPDLIEENEILYLDTDLIIETDIIELCNGSIGNFEIGAVASTPVQHALEHRFFIKTLNISSDILTFNAGVLLINADKWRKENIKAKLLEIANKYPQELLSADQALLNAYFAGNFLALPEKYNLHWHPDKEPVIKSDAIYHFVGSPKPWDLFAKTLHSGYAKWKAYNSSYWEKNVLGKHIAGQLKRCWNIRGSYVKSIHKKL